MYEPDSVTWNRISVWLQKITISKMGLLTYEYHYQTKSSKPCVVIEIDTGISRRFAAYALIEKDLRDTLSFIDEYHQIEDKEIIKGKDILLKALSRAIVITYGKCFTTAEGRRVKLEKNIISEACQAMHEELMNARHEYVAHAGNSAHELCKCVFLLPPEKKLLKGQITHPMQCTELRQSVGYKYFSELYKPLVEEVHAWVKNKLSDLLTILSQQLSIDIIPPQEFYKLAKNKGNRIILNEKDFQRLVDLK